MFRRFFLPALSALIPLSAALAACSVSAGSSFDDVASPDAGETSNGTDNPTTLTTSGGTKTDTAGAIGNPICKVVTDAGTTCWPDEDGVQSLPSGTSACAPSVPDGGAPQAPATDASTKVSACRISAAGDAPSCDADGADTRGVDGVSCQTGADCAPGFDCVDGDNGAVCRRYCCSGTCDGYPAANNGPTFCDVQSVNREGVTEGARPIAPVCMPVKSCTLLQDGDCSSKETCAIVNDKGATGCVGQLPGVAVGASCEQSHCGPGQTCLGAPGNRKCYQLCRTNGGTECGSNETCTTSAAFQDTSYGICKTQH